MNIAQAADGRLVVSEFRWKFGLMLMAGAGIVLLESLLPGVLPTALEPDMPMTVMAAFAAVWAFTCVVYQQWAFDLSAREVVLRSRYLFGARVRRIPFADLRRIFAEEGRNARTRFLTLLHCKGMERFRSYALGSEYDQVGEVASELRSKVKVAQSMTDDEIIREIMQSAGVLAAVKAARLMKGLTKKQAREWLCATREVGGSS